ncbi:hypothetical protein HGQ98_28120 [Achromobacter ruhlandii]|uniref:Uncharacterized protein n=1 Tax=Achromobacter ruhlandii TaxID=72557 RepID=A0A848NQZ6_9BURK|nr:hypothetical protein [Achromobacter ruhlandii]
MGGVRIRGGGWARRARAGGGGLGGGSRLVTGRAAGWERGPRTPWLLLLAAVLLYSLLGYWSGHRYDYSFDINDTITSMVFIVATGLLVAGCAWALRSSIRWLRLAGPGSVAEVARR